MALKSCLKVHAFQKKAPSEQKSSKLLPHVPSQVQHFAEAPLQAVLMTSYRSITPQPCSPSPALLGGKAHTSTTQSKRCSAALNLASEYKPALHSSEPPTSSTTCYSHQLKAVSEKHQKILEGAELAAVLLLLFSPTQTTILKLHTS